MPGVAHNQGVVSHPRGHAVHCSLQVLLVAAKVAKCDEPLRPPDDLLVRERPDPVARRLHLAAVSVTHGVMANSAGATRRYLVAVLHYLRPAAAPAVVPAVSGEGADEGRLASVDVPHNNNSHGAADLAPEKVLLRVRDDRIARGRRGTIGEQVRLADLPGHGPCPTLILVDLSHVNRDPADIGDVAPGNARKLLVEPGDEAAARPDIFDLPASHLVEAGQGPGRPSLFHLLLVTLPDGHHDSPELFGKAAENLKAPSAILPRSEGVPAIVFHSELIGAVACVAEAVQELGSEARESRRGLANPRERTLVLRRRVIALRLHNLRPAPS
mmetsp:Transcript_3164/g.6643  ORF Transcript_3164/g.6643 Transcript_3164/m.6643 type:complete len:328 (+) Transcript_3164:605-1588(+)